MTHQSAKGWQDHALFQCFKSAIRRALRSQSRSAGGVEQPRDGAVDLLVLAFAVVLEYDFSALIDNVLRRPILVAIGVPGLRVVVLRDRIGNSMPLQRGLDVGCRSLERKFRRVDAERGRLAARGLAG